LPSGVVPCEPAANEYIFEYIKSSRSENVLTIALTVREVQAAKPKSKPYGLADGDGLLLWVTPDDSKFWHFRFRLRGKQPRISLGRYPDISLQQARLEAAAYRALVAKGVDPREKRRIDKQKAESGDDRTFRAAAERWYKGKQDAGRSASTLDKIRTYLDKVILPELGAKALPDITVRTARGSRSASKSGTHSTSPRRPEAGSAKFSARRLLAANANSTLRPS
jgi:hypothetical protein